MNGLARRKGGDVVPFNPRKTKERSSVLDAAIAHAKRIKDWDALERAVTFQIKEQRQFVAWWRKNVTPGHGAGRGKKGADRGAFLSAAAAEAETGIRHQQVSRWGSRLENVEAYARMIRGPSYAVAMAQLASELVQQSLSDEHYTPAKYVEAARIVLGDIDLDPASCEAANVSVKAKKFFDIEEDGLGQEWKGRIWLNPPYGRLVGDFIRKLVLELGNGNANSAIALVNAHCTDTDWFRSLWDGCLCFTDHRINFFGDESRSGSTHGSVFVYFGNDRAKFAHNFNQFGAIVARVVA